MGESAREGVELSGVEKQGEWESDAKLRGRIVRVSVLRRESVCAGENTCDGEHVQTEDTCQRDTSDASGQQWANARREVATPFSFSLFIWGLCVSVVEALSGKFSIV